jgi:hypothetical protein
MALRLLDILQGGSLTTTDVKALAVGLIEVVDVFLIAIGMYMISTSLYTLFVDDILPLPRWLIVSGLEAVKANLREPDFAEVTVSSVSGPGAARCSVLGKSVSVALSSSHSFSMARSEAALAMWCRRTVKVPAAGSGKRSASVL